MRQFDSCSRGGGGLSLTIESGSTIDSVQGRRADLRPLTAPAFINLECARDGLECDAVWQTIKLQQQQNAAPLAATSQLDTMTIE